jgi:taurine--2-oxoglutarate transaminase
LVITKAEDIYLWDDAGNKYYDMSSQLVNANLGHGNKAVVQAIKDQADKIPFINPAFALDVRSEAAKLVVEAAGLGEGSKVFFTNAGAEANENAIKMAKAVTGRWKCFSMYRSYHGSSAGSGSLTGEPRRFSNEPGVPGFIKFDGPYAYRAPKACKFNSEEDVTEFYLELLENQIKYENPKQIAAIFVETVVGSNGILIPPKGYLAGVRALCDKYGIMMVCDEVMAGWYRIGTTFGFQRFDIKPDMVTFAKGATCGYVPLGGVIVSPKIAQHFDDNKMFMGLTYSAHPLGCAALIATIAEYARLDIASKVAKTAPILGELLEDLAKKHASVGEVRYIGLFSCLELVKDDKGTPLVAFAEDPDGIMPKIIGMLRAEGFLTYPHENMIIVAPPLIITEEELRDAMKILDKVLNEVDAMIK